MIKLEQVREAAVFLCLQEKTRAMLGRCFFNREHWYGHGSFGVNKMGKPKPLLKSEVPNHLHQWINFETQTLVQANQRCKALTVDVACPLCKETRKVRASNIRKFSKKGVFTALCILCGCPKNLPLPRKGPDHHSWTGGRSISYHGYITVNLAHFSEDEQAILREMVKGEQRIPEHRAVVALALRRSLTRKQHIHHINGVRTDNRLENLQIVDHHKRLLCPKCAVVSPTMADCVACDL